MSAHNDFKPARFMPLRESPFESFADHVRRQQNLRADRQPAAGTLRRVSDVTEVVDVDVLASPDFADTVPVAMDPEDVTIITPETIESDPQPLADARERANELMARATAFVAAASFRGCLQQGYFPPRCQKCHK